MSELIILRKMNKDIAGYSERQQLGIPKIVLSSRLRIMKVGRPEQWRNDISANVLRDKIPFILFQGENNSKE